MVIRMKIFKKNMVTVQTEHQMSVINLDKMFSEFLSCVDNRTASFIVAKRDCKL